MTDSSAFHDLGFRCGLEIHQQLLTERKLFCRCPAGLRPEEPDARIVRHMRPTLSEMGEYDGTALMEFKTRKEVVYELFRHGTCTYEMDDTPPFPLNREALEIAIEIGLLLHCNIVDEVHVTRKQYLDGSIPTGFQRTAIVGLDGWIPYRGRRIGIAQITLEEDACREVSDDGHTIVFRTDRLSMPLIEVTTRPDMLDPREAAEVNEEIGRLLRVTGRVRRDQGAVRQDVNVSVAGGTRVEIKGVPSYRHAAMTAIEARRQRVLLDLREKVAGRDRGALVAARADLTGALAESTAPALAEAREQGWAVGGIRLRTFADVLATEVQPGVPFAREIEGRVRVIACLDRRPILLHGGSPDAGGLTADDWTRVRAALGHGDGDACLLVRGAPEDVETALDEIAIRAREVWDGVPSETRQPLVDGTTDFERILPGPDRMYPDTDTEPVALSRPSVTAAAASLPERPWDREERLVAAGVEASLARRLAVSPRYEAGLRALDEELLSPSRLASVLVADLVALGRDGVPVGVLDDDAVLDALRWCRDRKRPDLAVEALRRAALGEAMPGALPSDEEGRRLVEAILAETGEAAFAGDAERRRWAVGEARARLGGVLAPGAALARAAAAAPSGAAGARRGRSRSRRNPEPPSP